MTKPPPGFLEVLRVIRDLNALHASCVAAGITVHRDVTVPRAAFDLLPGEPHEGRRNGRRFWCRWVEDVLVRTVEPPLVPTQEVA